jgi:hypothetical protein
MRGWRAGRKAAAAELVDQVDAYRQEIERLRRQAAGPVFIVLEHPDMTYYGDAEIHGVYPSRDAAETRARALDPRWKPGPDDWTNYGIEEWAIGETGQH